MYTIATHLMASNDGLITRRQALEAGFTADQIDRLVRQRVWVAVRRGVYAERELWESLTTWPARQLMRDRAASLRISMPHVMSHGSAALELDLGILRPREALTHVTRPGVVGSHVRYGVKHHLAPYRDEQVREVGRRLVLDPARTALDIAREDGLRAGVVACDSALRLGASKADLRDASLPWVSWPFVTVAREAIELSDPGSDSVGETLSRELVEELGFGRPETQFGLTDGHRRAWCDLRIGRHVFEFDGRVKYRRREDGGLALVSAEDTVWYEKQRQDWICGFKLGMSRIVWDDFWGAARERARERLRREVLDTLARFGDSIDDLTPFIVRAPRRRAA